MSPSRFPGGYIRFSRVSRRRLSEQAASTPVDRNPPLRRLPLAETPTRSRIAVARCGEDELGDAVAGRTGIASPPWLRFHADIKHDPS
jgi:hypothetical protein